MIERPWEERWRQKRGEPLPEPDPWLLKYAPLLTGGTALDLACGRGRNSLLLARHGYQVLALDSSPTALELLHDLAAAEKLPIKTQVQDLTLGLPPAAARFDLILCAFYLQRDLFAAIKAQTEPGGLFIGRSFCQLQPEPVPHEIIYQPGELAGVFNGWEILAYEEGVVTSHRGGTLAGIVARKPQGGCA